jgi:hypothetical protein
MARSSSARDPYELNLIALPFISRYTSCSLPRKPRRRKPLMLSKKPMELVSITFSHHHHQTLPTADAAPLIQLRTDAGRTIIHEKPGMHLDPSVHGGCASPPHAPALATTTDPTHLVRFFDPLSAQPGVSSHLVCLLFHFSPHKYVGSRTFLCSL